ncbi:MnhB domain-containing protein [Actinophytocola sp.]|uniref:MnhB domain-containing protein n=1 Tax=Actinophytocola sp. TaxID=1872138 RepID=UPI003D6B9EBE
MRPDDVGVPDSVVRAVARLLPRPSLMVAAALIVKGYAEVGDGFAAGVVVALAVALIYVAFGAEGAEQGLPMLRYAPTLAIGGLLLALASGFFPLAFGEPPVTHRPTPDEHVVKIGMLELFTPLLFDIGIFLLVVGVLTMLLHQLGRPLGEGRR